MMKEAEAAALEDEAVDFPEVDADRKDEATLRDAVAEEALAPAGEEEHLRPGGVLIASRRARAGLRLEYSAMEFEASYV